jgi:subtilisin-like proprotein convertase family protein
VLGFYTNRARPPTPALAIPDNHQPGVSNKIIVDETVTVRSVEVSLAITHTYRGDLAVELIGPDGTAVTLHNRVGGTRDNLVRTYLVVDTTGLTRLTGKSAQGNWTLHIRDMAAIDVATLDRWTLTLGLEGGPYTEWQASPGLAIPDNNPQGIVSGLNVDASGVLTDIELTVDINHTFRGGLRATLETPDGLSAKIHNLTGGRADNLKRTYRAADTPTLQALVNAGVEIHGTWQLKVSDHAPVDLGKLNTWKLKLHTRS